MTLKYLPEGALLNLPRNKAFIGSRKGLESAQKQAKFWRQWLCPATMI